MELTQAQYERIAPYLPLQRGNVRVSNRQVLNAILYVAEQGCKWRGLPARFGNWHTIYTRMNRWSKNGVLDGVFEQLQREQIVRIRLDRVEARSTSFSASAPTGKAPVQLCAPGWRIILAYAASWMRRAFACNRCEAGPPGV